MIKWSDLRNLWAGLLEEGQNKAHVFVFCVFLCRYFVLRIDYRCTWHLTLEICLRASLSITFELQHPDYLNFAIGISSCFVSVILRSISLSEMLLSETLYSISSIALVGSFVIFFWVLMWKYVFEPNPLVRDFFDLDRKPKVDGSSKKK